jgi:hypothetical protein
MVALDGADSRLLDAWSVDGTLPSLGAVRARGRAGKLNAPAGITDDGLWATFQYAAGLGEHGRYHHRQLRRDGTWGLAIRDEADMPRFWDKLSTAGCRVAILDVPKCAPPRPLNGIHLADWEVHGKYSSEPQSFPPELCDEVVQRFGAAPPSRCDHLQAALSDPEVTELMGHLGRGIAQKRAAALHYLARQEWDVFVVGFKEAHCAGHAMWDLADASHPSHDQARNMALGQPMRHVMAALDAAVGDLIEAAGPDAEVIAFSTSEIVPNGSLEHLMPEIVERLNVALGHRGVLRRLRGLFHRPPPLQLLPYNENCAAIRVTGGPGVVERAIAVFAQMTEPETGAKAFAGIERPSRTERGVRAAQLPDILLHYTPGLTPAAVKSPRLGTFGAAVPSIRPGNHAPGLFVISAGPRSQTVGGPASLEDFGPLIERLLAASPA